MILEDFSSLVRDAIKSGAIEELVREYNGDLSLDYLYSKEKVPIKRQAFEEQLQDIFDRSKTEQRYENKDNGETGKTVIEIAFTGIYSPKEGFVKFISGEMGTKDGCYWDEGDLLPTSYEEAKKLESNVSTDHTHPVITPDNGPIRKYGALPSWIPYTPENISEYVLDKELMEEILQSQIYKKWGGDYCELFMRSQINPLVTPLSIIMSPALNQLGIFDVQPNGKVVYHPWEII